MIDLPSDSFRVPTALRRVPRHRFARLLPIPKAPRAGDIVLARVESIGKNTRLELANGRPCTLHEGDRIAAVFGNRYATAQFEGYAKCEGDACDLLSMGGVCGLVASKHDKVLPPSKLRMLGAIGDGDGQPLTLRDFSLPPVSSSKRPKIVAVCGTAMDSGKTHTAMSLIMALRERGHAVGAVKLTGTCAGRDTWTFHDAGASPALDFVDGGFPSTYLCKTDELLGLYDLLISHAAAGGAEWVVMEIADGLLERETTALLQHATITSTVDAWLFAAVDPLGAVAGVELLRTWGIAPIAISGVISMSPLAMKEVRNQVGIPCVTGSELRNGVLSDLLAGVRERSAAVN